MAKFRLRAVFAVAAGILITIGGCADNSPTGSTPPQDAGYQLIALDGAATGAAQNRGHFPFAEKVIGPEGGTLEIPGGHTLDFPSGALDKPTKIRAKVDRRYVAVELEPHGIQFSAGREPLLTLNYSAAATPVIPNHLTIIYLDQAYNFLEDMRGTASERSKIVSARLPHFSVYAVGNGT